MTKKKANILIIDDEQGSRDSLWMILKPFNNLYSADSGQKALEVLQDREIDLVTMDLRMPGLQGVDLLREIKRRKASIEIIIITGYGSLKSAIDGIRYGAADYLLKPFNVAELLSAINRALEKKHRLDALRDFLSNLALLEGHVDGKPTDYLQFARVLANTLESRDKTTYHHSLRVNLYANLIANELNLSPKQHHDLELGSFLHDIGKLGIDNRVLYKEGKLDEQEMEAARKHTEIGANLVTPLDLSTEIVSIIRHHHEQFDGNGYPDRLKGEQIPILTRIISLVESFDAMIADRPYRKALPLDHVIGELKRCSGTQWDNHLVDALLEIIAVKGDEILPAFIDPEIKAIGALNQ